MTIDPCHHLFKPRFQDVVACYEKREGGPPVYADGDYQECSECFDGRFIPHNKELRTVPCEIVISHLKAKEPF